MKRFCWTMLFLIAPAVVFADVMEPLSYYALPLFIPIILVEAILLIFLTRKWLGRINFLKLLLMAVLANVASSAAGRFIPIYKHRTQNLMWICVAYILSVFIEWIVYIPFIRKRYLLLLGISAITNLASYLLLAALAV